MARIKTVLFFALFWVLGTTISLTIVGLSARVYANDFIDKFDAPDPKFVVDYVYQTITFCFLILIVLALFIGPLYYLIRKKQSIIRYYYYYCSYATISGCRCFVRQNGFNA